MPDDLVTHVRERVAAFGDTRAYTFLAPVKLGSGEVVEHRLTFTELDRRARAVGAWLTGRGLADEAVLLLYPAGLEFVTVFLGCLYARVMAVPAPLPQADPRARERARNLAGDAAIRLVLTDSAHEPTLAGWLPEGQASIVATDTAELADPGSWSPPGLGPDTIAYLQYTSGSTSEPRGVAVSHANLLHNLHAISSLTGRSSREGLAGWLPHHHDMGLIGLLLHALYVGGDLVFTSPMSFVARPALWLEMISRYRAGWTVAPDFAYRWCTRRVSDEQLAALDLSSLTTAMSGAEPIRAATLAAFEERFAAAGFRPESWGPCYGMAEATLLITGVAEGTGAVIRPFDAVELERHYALPAADGVALVSSGRPVGLDVRVVEPRTREVLAEGSVGEIWVAGGSVALGYRGRAAATRETFHARTASGHGPYLRTGDLGFLLDGDLYVTGRLKDLIIVNGRNLYPQDIEELAGALHTAAGAGAAFGLDSGREHVVLVQEVRLAHLRGDTTVERFATGIVDELTRAFQVPVNLVLVGRGGVRKTTSGKVGRARMRELLLSGQLPALHTDVEPEVADLLGSSP